MTKMQTVPVPMTTVSLATGEETHSTAHFMLLPPAAHLCQTCGHDHPADQPHNAQKLYYQTAFHAEHGRAPTWRDAIAHCDEATQARWTEALTARGVDMDGGVNP